MWKDYSKSYIRNNRGTQISIMAAVFLATLFLSLLCCTAYNFWTYEIEKIVLEEGDWQARIVGALAEDDLALIGEFQNVDKAVVNESLSVKGKAAVDIYFRNARRIYADMPLIVERLGLEENEFFYHELLLSRYFIYDPQDKNPPLLLPLFLGILIIVSLSLILIIRNSFEISMNARVHQFGILSSIGATPKQIKICLLQEAAYLSALPMLLGTIFGVAMSFCLIEAINFFARDVAGRWEAAFGYHPFICLVTILSSALTVLFSAWIPARKLSKMAPLWAIRNTESLQFKKKRHSRILGALFGIKGEIAGNALKAQKKALRLSALSLTLSLLGFSVMLMFTTLSNISTQYTYFERYHDAWDVMIRVKDTAISELKPIKELRAVSGAEDVAVYQKMEAAEVIWEEWQSEALTDLGGLGIVAGILQEEGGYLVKAPVILLDNESFYNYCEQIGVSGSLDGAIVLNRIWDSVNSNFRYKKYVPFVKEDRATALLSFDSSIGRDGAAVEIPVLGYTQREPVLREEYDDYALVYFIPLSVWQASAWKEEDGQQAGESGDCFVRILSKGSGDLADLSNLEKEAAEILGPDYEIESENRVKERISNDSMITGMMVILGGFCALLATIGIANVFSNTLGFLRHRKREFARYMSIGLTPREMREIFLIEALVIAGRPLLITLPITVLFVQFMVKASYLEPMVFWHRAPIIPVLLFALCIVGFVALAYYIGGRRLLKCDLNEILRNDTMI